MWRALPTLFLLILISTITSKPLVAQSPMCESPCSEPQTALALPSAERQAEALALLEKSLDALGGSQRASSVANSVATGISNLSNGETRSLVWKDLIASDIASSVEITSDKGQTGFATSKAASVSLDPAARSKPTWFSYLSNQPFHLPAILLYRIISDDRYSVRSCGPSCVETVLETDLVSQVMTQQRWRFSEKSGLPETVEYKIPDPRFPENSDTSTLSFSDFRSVAGILVPFQIVERSGNVDRAVVSISSVVFNTGVTADANGVPK